MTPLTLWFVYIALVIHDWGTHHCDRTHYAPSWDQSFRPFSETLSNIHYPPEVPQCLSCKQWRSFETYNRSRFGSSHFFSPLWLHTCHASICDYHGKFHNGSSHYDGICTRNCTLTSRSWRTHFFSLRNICQTVL